MFYTLSKVAWFFATPSNLLVSLILLGLILSVFKRVRPFGMILSIAMTLATIALGLSPIASYVLTPLEERFPPFRDDGRPVDGIVLLGSFLKPLHGFGSVLLDALAVLITDSHVALRLCIAFIGGFAHFLDAVPCAAALLHDFGDRIE